MPQTAKSSNKRRSRRSGWGWPVLAILLLAAVTAGLLAFARYQSPDARWHRQYEAGRAERLGEQGQSTRSAGHSPQTDWRPIHGQLVEYSRHSFPVIVGQTGQWGGANPSGHILLDLTTLRDPRDILAFKLAHEWAHLMLGHVNPHQQHQDPGQYQAEQPTSDRTEDAPLAETPGEPAQTRRSAPTGGPTAMEDAADAWAGQFLATYGYNLETVADYLRNVPYDPTDTVHSPGPERADIVLSTTE